MELFTANVFTAATITIWCFMTFLFGISVILKRNDIADVAWGTGILLVGIVGYLYGYVLTDGGNSGLSLLLLLLYTLWGLRLTYRIGKRNLRKSEEDYRYKRWRDEWGRWFYLRSYFQVYILQGVLMIVVGFPLLLVGFSGAGMLGMSYWMLLGIALWCIGYFFEVVGDHQLDQFIAKKKAGETDKNIMTAGLWKYSRHPNYFGEVTMWWGIWLMVAHIPLSWVALISPVMITFLILKVSGVPLLEEKYAGESEWEEYKKRTSIFFPLPPTSASKEL